MNVSLVGRFRDTVLKTALNKIKYGVAVATAGLGRGAGRHTEMQTTRKYHGVIGTTGFPSLKKNKFRGVATENLFAVAATNQKHKYQKITSGVFRSSSRSNICLWRP